jgi:hypothetical protein
MMPLVDSLRLTAGPRREFASVLQRAVEDLESRGLTLMRLNHDEFMTFNRNSDASNWYRLHDHYGHERFVAIAITNSDNHDVRAVLASRPLDLAPGRTLADAFDDLSFVYPSGVPMVARDRFEHIPMQAAALRGKGCLVGGLWIDPRASTGTHSGAPDIARNAAARVGLGGSLLLSYLTRSMATVLLGTEDPDFIAILVTDRLIQGHAEGRSMLRRYGYHHVAKGPVWGNHYPGQDLALNLSWIDRAGQLDVVLRTPWAGEAALAPFIPGVAAA